MEPMIYKPSIYNGAGIYKAGAEGGGGGGGLPDGYKQCAYFEFLQNTTLYDAGNGSIFTDVQSTDNIKVICSLVGGVNNNNDGISIVYRKGGNQISPFKIIYNNSTNKIRLQSFWEYIEISYQTGIICYGRFGALQQIFIENSFVSSDINDYVKGIKSLFSCDSVNYAGSKFSLFEIKGNDGIVKHKLIPAVNTNNNTKVVIDVITGFEITLDTSKIDCGPVVD